MRVFIVDSNVFLRFFLNDNPEQAEKVREFFKVIKKENDKILVEPITIAEIVYHLRTTYSLAKEQAVEMVLTLFIENWIVIPHKEAVIEALVLYKRKQIDLEDLILWTIAKAQNIKVVSFDKDFKKLDKDRRYVLLLN